GDALGELDVSEVGRPHARLRRVLLAVAQDLLQAVGSAGDDPDGGALLGEHPGEGGPDAGGRARDEERVAVGLHVAVSAAATAFSTAVRRSSVVTPMSASGWWTSGPSKTPAMRERRAAVSPAGVPTR